MGLRRANKDDLPPLESDYTAPRAHRAQGRADRRRRRSTNESDLLVYTSQVAGLHGCIRAEAERLNLSMNKFCLRVLANWLRERGYGDELDAAHEARMQRHVREEEAWELE